MSATAEAWSGDFGRSYTQRNRVDWRARIPFWADVLDMTGARSVYEVGTNCGFNLTAIKYADYLAKTYGCEINPTAATQARIAGHEIDIGPALAALHGYAQAFDLVVTCGVLIHIPTSELKSTMEAAIRASADYVLAVEYAAGQEEEVNYRGQSGMLWRRPYRKLYEGLGLRLVKEWDAGAGFDRCTASLMRVPA